MKRIFLIVLTFSLFLCGCNTQINTESKPTSVIINLPENDSINGYRLSDTVSASNTEMPDIIRGEDTVITDITDDSGATVSKSLCGNKNSKVFHSADCGSVSKMKEENKVYFENRNKFINNGYKPCGTCKP